jgi:uncharacterized membrane protein YhaH (DUF805 family)
VTFGLAVTIVTMFLDVTFDLWAVEPQPGTPALLTGTGMLTSLVALLLLVPSISSYVTRLHDRGHSAWWLLWILVPCVGAIVLFVQTACLRGHDAPNQYGPVPADPGSRPVGV